MNTKTLEIGSAFEVRASAFVESAVTSSIAAATAFVNTLAAAYARHRAFKAAESSLLALDNWTLKDIGLDRSEFASAIVNRNNERRNGADAW